MDELGQISSENLLRIYLKFCEMRKRLSLAVLTLFWVFLLASQVFLACAAQDDDLDNQRDNGAQSGINSITLLSEGVSQITFLENSSRRWKQQKINSDGG